VVTNVGHRIPVQRALRAAGSGDATVILEPFGRNTAPAVAAAALEVIESRGDELLLVLPADHAISDVTAFAEAIDTAAVAAADGYLVTFGITPTSPETGYGYIRSGDHLVGSILRIEEFKEKPDPETASAYLASGRYSWNSGMFIFRASRYLEELESFRPDIASASRSAWESGSRTGNELLLDAEAFRSCPTESIDFAVMEHTDGGAVLPIDPGWSDVGSWASLWEIATKDDDGNAVIGDVLAIDTHGSYIRASERLIATVGVDDVVIVDTPDALLVTTRQSSQDVKLAVDRLRASQRKEVMSNDTEYEPWGTARLIGESPGHRAHLVIVDPGASIPERSVDETSHHWHVVGGIGEFIVDGTRTTVASGSSVYVSPGSSHAIDNTTVDLLMLIRLSVDTVVEEDELRSFAAKEGLPT